MNVNLENKIEAINDTLESFLNNLRKNTTFYIEEDRYDNELEQYEISVESSIWDCKQLNSWAVLKEFLLTFGIDLIDGEKEEIIAKVKFPRRPQVTNPTADEENEVILNEDYHSTYRAPMAIISKDAFDKLDIGDFTLQLHSYRRKFVEATVQDAASEISEELKGLAAMTELPAHLLLKALSAALPELGINRRQQL